MEFQNDNTKIPETPSPEIKKGGSKENSIKEVLKFTLIAFAIVIPIRMFVAQPFIVSGASMDPTFKSGEYLIVDQLTYFFRNPTRGEVIIFRYPNNPKTFYIKRVIGLPGETVEIVKGEIIIKNKDNKEGIKVDSSYVTKEHKTIDSLSISLRDNEYFVLGDNRAESSDSRLWGPLEDKYVVGRPFIRLFPVTKIKIFPGK